ncbi:hypothetical protein KIPB_014800, partial [Kipferlia bialata]
SFCEDDGCEIVVSQAEHGLWAITNLLPEVPVKTIRKFTTYYEFLID